MLCFRWARLPRSISARVSSADRVGGSFCLSEHKSRTAAIGPIPIILQLFFYDCYWMRTTGQEQKFGLTSPTVSCSAKAAGRVRAA